MFADVPKYILNKVEWDWYTPIQIFWDLLFWFKPLKFIRLFLQEQSEQFLTNFKAAKIFQQAFYCFRQISPDVHSNCSKLCFLLPSNTVPKWVHNLKFNGKQTLKIDLFSEVKKEGHSNLNEYSNRQVNARVGYAAGCLSLGWEIVDDSKYSYDDNWRSSSEEASRGREAIG